MHNCFCAPVQVAYLEGENAVLQIAALAAEESTKEASNHLCAKEQALATAKANIADVTAKVCIVYHQLLS